MPPPDDARPPPAVAFETGDVVLARGGAFTFSVDRAGGFDVARLVLDIYDLDNPVHPDGHIGWWEFDLALLPPRASGRLSLDDRGHVDATIEGIAPVNAWRNATPPRASRMELLGVLRSADNGLVSIRRIPVLKADDDLKAFRSSFDRNYHSRSYATPPRPLDPERRIHIVAPNIFPRDAVGNLCLDLFRLLSHHGADAFLYAANSDLSLNDVIMTTQELPDAVRPTDSLVYFFSTHDPDLARLTSIPCRSKIAYFHGVTEPRLLQAFEPELSAACARAIADIPLLAGFDRLSANSVASAERLRAALVAASCPCPGDIAVIPPLILGAGQLPLKRPPPGRIASAAAVLLFVGRIVSHKKIEDLLSLLAEYRSHDPAARCVIVGHCDHGPYRDHLRAHQKTVLDLPDDAVLWRNSVNGEQLDSLYREASVYVSMSEDEGFCLPLFEAMSRNVPVFAYDLPAVRETLGDGGVTFAEKDFRMLAGKLRDLLTSQEAMDKVLDAQYRRAGELVAQMDGRYFLDLLTDP